MQSFAVLTFLPRTLRRVGISLCAAVLPTVLARGEVNGAAEASPSPAGPYGLSQWPDPSSWAAIGCGVGVLFLLACRPRRHR